MPRWAGPPPLLIAVTVVSILVTPAVSRAQVESSSGDRAVAQGSLVAGDPAAIASKSAAPTNTATPTTPEPTSRATPEAPEPTTAAAPKAVETKAAAPKAAAPKIKPRRIGVATFNQYVDLDTDAATEDALALTSRPGVSIIGWQEGFSAGPVYQLLAKKGWATKRYGSTKGARELAVSWRKSEFAFASSVLHKLAEGVAQEDGRYPFGTRYALRVTLRDRASGELLSVINTHLPQRVEDLDNPGTWNDTKNAVRASRQLEGLATIWDRAPGRWVVGTGDYNIAALADQRARNDGGVVAAYDGIARSSYSVLGFGDVDPTHPTSGRYIDYVHVARPDLKSGRVELVSQRTQRGLNSDHRPLVVRMRLS